MNQVAGTATNVAGTATDVSAKVVDAVVNVNVNAVEPFVFSGCCCESTSIGLNYPDCIGTSFEGVVCCCIAARVDACKPIPGNDTVFMFASESILCVKPGKTICKAKHQFWCLETRFALPCDSDSPCMCTFCFIELFRSDQFTTDIKPKLVVLPRIAPLSFSAPTVPSIAR